MSSGLYPGARGYMVLEHHDGVVRRVALDLFSGPGTYGEFGLVPDKVLEYGPGRYGFLQSGMPWEGDPDRFMVIDMSTGTLREVLTLGSELSYDWKFGDVDDAGMRLIVVKNIFEYGYLDGRYVRTAPSCSSETWFATMLMIVLLSLIRSQR